MNVLESVQQFFSGWRFPVVMISSLLFLVLAMGVVLLIPESDTAAAAFARDFKVWCFGYDPSTGSLEWAYVWMFLVQPWLMIGLVTMIWLKPLREVLRTSRRRLTPYVLGTFVAVCGLAAAVVASASPFSEDEQTFPGERIRTSVAAPDFELVNHENERVSMGAFADRVVLITGVYTRCGRSCPFILAQTKRVLNALDEADLEGLTTLAVTLDPDRDTVEDLKRMARVQGLSAPGFQALTGDPGVVNEVLDKFGFSRTVNEETGEINHANLFILVDRNGKIAYRFALGTIQETWMREAIRSLLAEPA